MKPQTPDDAPQDDLFRHRLDKIISLQHPLVRLADRIEREAMNQLLGAYYEEAVVGQPPKPTRLMAGLLYLKHTYFARYLLGLNKHPEAKAWPQRTPVWSARRWDVAAALPLAGTRHATPACTAGVPYAPKRALEIARRIRYHQVTLHERQSASGITTLSPEQRELFDTISACLYPPPTPCSEKIGCLDSIKATTRQTTQAHARSVTLASHPAPRVALVVSERHGRSRSARRPSAV